MPKHFRLRNFSKVPRKCQVRLHLARFDLNPPLYKSVSIDTEVHLRLGLLWVYNSYDSLKVLTSRRDRRVWPSFVQRQATWPKWIPPKIWYLFKEQLLFRGREHRTSICELYRWCKTSRILVVFVASTSARNISCFGNLQNHLVFPIIGPHTSKKKGVITPILPLVGAHLVGFFRCLKPPKLAVVFCLWREQFVKLVPSFQQVQLGKVAKVKVLRSWINVKP